MRSEWCGDVNFSSRIRLQHRTIEAVAWAYSSHSVDGSSDQSRYDVQQDL
jgi:hypothetical protein